MSWSLNVGAVAGTAIRIHVTFLLLLGWIFGVNYISGGPQAAWSALLFVVLLFLCVLLHDGARVRRQNARRDSATTRSELWPN